MTQFPDTVNPIEPEFAEPPKWPKVIGIISIVWSVIGLGCTGCGVVGIFMGSFAGGMMKEQFSDGLPPQFTEPPPISLIIAMGFGGLVTLLLMGAGIALVMRKYAARMLHLLWVVMAVISVCWSSYVQVGQSQATKQWVRDNPSTKFAQAQSQANSGLIEIGAWVLGLSIGLAYPTFCAVWFGLVKKKPAEYTKGVEQLM